ncbi:helix-turn-helix domain-containing protein [Embleya sp. NBC_00888]|uniref:helix-turn-helix domain-containing protein n=1 Tax=Embleya sp. NBC_00888 TaxID=2975960 RepID=UPI00386E1B37|nr:helix-turn-helix domain-containing protein [Embleya sp. NBC_00888]
MNARRGITRCAACGRRFAQRKVTGRKRLYCDPTCRRRAQRVRERARAQARAQVRGMSVRVEAGERAARVRAAEAVESTEFTEHAGRVDPRGLETGIVAILRRVACALEEAERTREPLRVRLAYADRLSGETQRYRAVVGEARPASATRLRPEWSAQLAARLGARADPGADAGGDEDLSSSQHAGERLAAALRELRRADGVTAAELAWQAGISEAFLDRILAGEVWASWPVVETLAGKLGGEARELRALWECSRGIDHHIRRELRDLALLLAQMLRGLWLAAGRPVPERIGGAPLTPDSVGRILAGELIPDRGTAELLVERLGAHPDVIRRLWTHVHYGVLIRLGDTGFPPGGLPFTALTGADPGADARPGVADVR